uniref:Cytochrome c oxidase subunit 3 n=1 Tax=Testudotaenia sp. WL-2016 TaxID=1873314 RepID=A0A1B1XZ14_9CEST|nr:cytochrome c oxidase subunit 3 [Testudotaenia sp. WL-2016]
MSFLPVYNAFITGGLLLVLFLWRIEFLPLIAIFLIASLTFIWWDLINVGLHYESAFWLFILSEVMAFGSLLICCFWFDTSSFVSLSSPIEIPFLGCFLLLGSSITVTGFHHLIPFNWSWVLLLLTIILGAGFVLLQMCEMNDIFINIFDSSFHASSFCTVGLHFSHVVLGVVGLSMILYLSPMRAGFYRCTVVTWYWHFVDYIWLFVYTLVYVC